MKITDLIKSLERMKEKVGDLEVRMLDDESGEMEPVAAVFHFKVGDLDENWVELATPRQAGDDRP